MSQDSQNQNMPFGKKNYIFLIAGVVLIVFGYFLMSREDFIDATQFSLALHVAPPAIILGFVVCIYAIMINPAKTNDTNAQD